MAQKSIGIIMNGVTGPDGLPPAPGAVHPGDPRAGRGAADRRRAGPGRADPGRPHARPSSPSWPRRHDIADYTTDLDAALADPRWRDLRRLPGDQGAGRGASARPSRRARRSTPRSRPRRASTRRSSWPPWPGPPGSRTAWCTTSCTCPGLRKLAPADRLRVLRPDPVGARRVRLLGLRGRLAAGAAAELELPGRGRRRHRRRHVPALELRAGEPVRPGRVGLRTRRHAHPDPRRRGRPAVHGHRRRRRLRGVRARRRRHRPAELELDGAGRPQGAGRVPGRRHPRQRRGRAASAAGSSPATPPRSRCGTPTCREHDYAADWMEVPDNDEFENGFKSPVGAVHPARRRGRAARRSTSSPAPAGSGWPRPAWRARAPAPGSTCPSSPARPSPRRPSGPTEPSR